MSEERLTKRAWRTEDGGRKGRRPSLRWKDSVNRGLEMGVWEPQRMGKNDRSSRDMETSRREGGKEFVTWPPPCMGLRRRRIVLNPLLTLRLCCLHCNIRSILRFLSRSLLITSTFLGRLCFTLTRRRC